MFLKSGENPNCVANSGGLLAEQTSKQVLRQWKLERLTDGSCLFGGETASSRDTHKSRYTFFQHKKKHQGAHIVKLECLAPAHDTYLF